jgi:hypothetical protein
MTSLEKERIRKSGDTRMERGIRWRDRASTAEDHAKIRMAERKARYGHRDWLQWTDKHGAVQVARQTEASLKQALLDCGTQYAFTQIGANGGWRMIITWPIGLNMLRNMKYW